MAAIRRIALEEHTVPAPLVRVYARPRWWPLLFGVPALLVLLAITIGGSFHPEDPVRYASFFPHFALNLFFFAFTGLAAASALLSMNRAWRAWHGSPIYRARPRYLLGAALDVVKELVTHRRFASCEQFPWSRWAHMGVFFGFGTLAALGGLVGLLLLFGVPYPFPILHPLKLVGNAAGLAVGMGTTWFLWQRWRIRRTEPSLPSDWLLLGLVVAVTGSGFVVEVLRLANLGALAYPTYFVHLVVVFVLLVGLPFSKLAHVAHRTLALISVRYQTLQEEAHRRAWERSQRLAS